MFRQNHPLDSLPEGIHSLSLCPICQSKYNPIGVRILEEREGSHLVYFTCRNCAGSVVSVVTHVGIGISSVGVLTDLSADEVVRYAHGEDPIALDDVLELHAWIEDPRKKYLEFLMN
ncbi:MAG: Uncharacterized protein G01um101418_214 [Parcubacteria group bacterium Gr01-1014_18]|nr:MAG: Uncharacterized protein Greene041636_182 [Parcubacteria group bacterium Greene0416_36]TSC81374.1 MAG: Uncharacterized protein G01um101418_214 [Parcubacteria group bacterium Gr01-1014_18]TSC99440.1 MAG: Uncharacterized protein Greene101420_107 [Parcubacteria group bacterium Greene1014_20]TSD07641.1 MAG: Uncharacterized protein Greene07142_98 [Parcubacteria group bacterium Greene0714_2]